MVDIAIEYSKELHCEAVHGPSGAVIATDAPTDNHGRGESFSPTDLVATGLGTCMVTVMGIRAQREGWQFEGVTVRVKKHMTVEPPRRIARLVTVVDVPHAVSQALSSDAKTTLEDAANHCPVRLSLLPAIDVPIEWIWR